MGFVHHWEVHDWNSSKWQQAWKQLIEDSTLIVLAADVPLCGAGGNSRHLSPLDPPIIDVDEGIYLNGIWEDGHEPFILSESNHHSCCKVAGGVAFHKPYGIVVACILLRAFILGPDHTSIGSDGRWNSGAWDDARNLYHSIWPNETLSCPWAAPGMSHDETKMIVYPPPQNIEQVEEVADSSCASLLQDLYHGSETTCTTSGHDLGPAKEWVSRCEAAHPACIASPLEVNNLPGVEFRLIDVQRRCIVVPDGPVSFLALSYVWGGTKQLKLKRATNALLLRDGSLNDLWPTLSTTVRDAVIVCEKMGERYLWTDSLCILQDSGRDMKVQISWMRQIYSAAKCTIVAVSAESAEVGLLGRKEELLMTPATEIELAQCIGVSPWSARAWCYQEGALSHRLLLFTSTGIFMQCQESSYDCHAVELGGNRHRDVDRFNSCGGMLALPSCEDPLESYLSAVAHYSRRKLSKPEDKLNAFTGILQRYQQIDKGEGFSLHYGLPIRAFDQTFCWRAECHTALHRNSNFPSWSWLGWIGPVFFDIDMLRNAHTNQVLYFNDEQTTSSEVDWRAARDLRKPANSGLLPPEDVKNSRFGFPATQHMNTSDSSTLRFAASVARLRISSNPTRLIDNQGYYAIYPTRCSQEPPDPPPKIVTLWDILYQPMPKLNLMDKETEAAPSLPASRPLDDDGVETDHDHHFMCEAQNPIGHICLQSEWRDNQPERFVMEFMALSGDKNEEFPERWTITLLMALQRMEKNGHFWARERLQVMDCTIEQQHWLDIGAETFNLKIV